MIERVYNKELIHQGWYFVQKFKTLDEATALHEATLEQHGIGASTIAHARQGVAPHWVLIKNYALPRSDK